MNVPASWRGVRNRLMQAPKEIQWYFAPAEELIEHYPWEVSLAYLFARLERAHIMTLYCGVVKLHKVDSELAAQSVDRFENRQADFRALFAKGIIYFVAHMPTMDLCKRWCNGFRGIPERFAQ